MDSVRPLGPLVAACGRGGHPGTFEVIPVEKPGRMQCRSGKTTDQLTFPSKEPR